MIIYSATKSKFGHICNSNEWDYVRETARAAHNPFGLNRVFSGHCVIGDGTARGQVVSGAMAELAVDSAPSGPMVSS